MPIRNIYLKIETIHDYSPVEPSTHGAAPIAYRRDCLRNPGHENGTIPPDEVEARRLTALVYREYLDRHWLIPKPDKIVFADVNEPAFFHRVPSAVLYAQPGDRLRIHVKNADITPHSFHLHGLSCGIDSDGVWPFGTQSLDGRRSDEISPGQTWTYTFDVRDDMLGAWPFYDHYRQLGASVDRGLFGGIVVLSRKEYEELPRFPLPKRLVELLEELDHDDVEHLTQMAPGAPAAADHDALPPELRNLVLLLDELTHAPQLHLIPKPPRPLHVPIFLHRMSGDSLSSFCFNGRSFVGNTPTILAESGQKILWYVFDLDFETSRHNVHPHAQRWRLAGETIDARSLGPAESFVAETTAPPVLLLPPDIEKRQSPKHRLPDARPFRLRGDFPFHCHVEAHMRQGLVGLVRATQTVWLTPEDAARLQAEPGLPLDLGDNDCPVVDLERSASSRGGRWEEVPGLPEVTMMHAALLAGSRRVLFWGYGPQADQSRIWDQDTGRYSQPSPQPQALTPDENIWSGAHAHLATPEGKILVHGGFIAQWRGDEQEGEREDETPEPPMSLDTERRSFFFDPSSLAWSKGPDTHVGRFYPTTITLGDGRLLTLFGQDLASGGVTAASLEVFDPGASPPAWSKPKEIPPAFDYLYYPWTFLLPSGDLFVAGPRTPARRFDWTKEIKEDSAQQWSFTIRAHRGDNMEGTAVLLPLDPPDYKARVLIAGGTPRAARKTAEWIDLSAATPAWQALREMNVSRTHLSSVILPDGHIFIAGGTDVGSDGGPAELFDPDDPAAGWQLGPAMKTRRLYHSAAILLSDGSVLMGGDTGAKSKDGGSVPHERYLPSYFFKPRPKISSAPTRIAYRAAFTIETPRAAAIGKVVLMRPGAVTHGFDASQRCVRCVIRAAAGTSVHVQAPRNGNVAPPGYYLLFLVDHDRVPSLGAWIRLGAKA